MSPFEVVYGYNPRAPVDLAPVPDLKRVDAKANERIQQLQQVHKFAQEHLTRANEKYKKAADKKRREVNFEVGDFVWEILTKDRFSLGDYNKLKARKIGPVEILAKINPNAYKLKLPSHIRTFVVFNVKHLVPYHGENTNDVDQQNSRTNFSQPRENDADESV
ncbi:uncharacterized protein LOC113341608 [Papaver somniferum]|uniref:uncharacterized protein LOC113341608 n=1 Tax=Papaver somniferum TaxID=3469 RepID=UPI000E6F6B60|nr:uncharacterized protein LOC113341608 [Papaver somniferum]